MQPLRAGLPQGPETLAGAALSSIRGTIQGDQHKNTVVIGGFYRRRDGSIVLTHGGNKDHVYWRTDNEKSGTATREEMDTWEYLPELRDFPNAEDPGLPYEFDLYWDCHTLSQFWSEGSDAPGPDDHLVRDLCHQYKLDLRDPQTVRDYNTRYAVERKKQLESQARKGQKGKKGKRP